MGTIKPIDDRTGCMICRRELVYGEKTEPLECYFCKKVFESNVKCINGHYVCDNCHSMPATEFIKQFCSISKSSDPLEMAIIIMRNQHVKIHGPEHHFLVPAVLIASYYNLKNDDKNKYEKLLEAEKRAKNIAGGFCGFYGDCGAGVGTGIFVSLITDATPLSKREWKLSNLMTAKSLFAMAKLGGPRCCKRNSYIAVIEVAKFLEEYLNTKMRINKKFRCEFGFLNKECIKSECPFFKDVFY